MKLVNKIMDVGFRMDEVMTGTHIFTPLFGDNTKKEPFEFSITWGPDSIVKWVNPTDNYFLRQRLTGLITVGGFCKDAHCDGVLELKYFSGQFLRYDFHFTVDGAEYNFIGEKVHIMPWNLPYSHTTCYGTITNKHGVLVSRSLTHFRIRTIPTFLASFRLTV